MLKFDDWRWAWLAQWLSRGHYIDDYWQQYAQTEIVRHKRGALRYMMEYLIELDRLTSVLADYKRLSH